MTITSKIMLNKSGESVPDLSGNSFSLSPLRIMLALGLTYMAYNTSRCVPSMPIFWRVLIINGSGILSKAFSASIDKIVWFFLFNLLMWHITLIDLQIKKTPCLPGINPT